MIFLRDIITEMEKIAPVELMDNWDNCGLMVGHPDDEISKVLLALDAPPAAAAHAAEHGYDAIITHHPLIFKPLMSLDFSQAKPQILRDLIKNNIAVYSAHTNLDRVEGGVSAALSEKLNLSIEKPLSNGYGFISQVSPISLGEFAKKVQNALGLSYIRFAGLQDKIIQKVAVCGGSGGDELEAVIRAGCDVFVTGDLRSHVAQEALMAGVALIDGTHYATEAPVLDVLRTRLAAAFPSLHIKVFEEACPFVLG
jgi:dinuclear metal center YbgI/SA1388 family protein